MLILCKHSLFLDIGTDFKGVNLSISSFSISIDFLESINLLEKLYYLFPEMNCLALFVRDIAHDCCFCWINDYPTQKDIDQF